MHPQSQVLTISWTVLKQSDELVILEWHLIPRWLLRSNFARFPEQVSKAWFLEEVLASIPWSIDCFLGDAFGVLSCPFWTTVLQCGAWLPIYTLTTGPCSQWCQFLNWKCVLCTRCTLFMVLYLSRMCRWAVHAVLWSHISTLMRLLVAEFRSSEALTS